MNYFTGVIQGTQVSTVQQLFGFLHPVLKNLVEVLGLYHNYAIIVELVLEVFVECAKRILCYLGPADSKILYERSVECIMMYANHNRGRRSVEKEAEEEQFQDLMFIMQLLTQLLSKEFIDLAPTQETENGQPAVNAAEVCLYGLNLIMPLMTLELLKFPLLCVQYFRTITLVTEIYPGKMCDLGADMERNLIRSLELGLTTLGVDSVYVLCCDFIQVLGCHFVRTPESKGKPIFEGMRPFLKVVYLFNIANGTM